jgi:hypothetical protein
MDEITDWTFSILIYMQLISFIAKIAKNVI